MLAFDPWFWHKLTIGCVDSPAKQVKLLITLNVQSKSSTFARALGVWFLFVSS
jgi:hypothetical protein